MLPREANTQYPPTNLVLFRDAVQSACGFADAASGPFYCPGDQKVYIDLSFYDELQSRFGAAGDFAQAYVIAHEYRPSHPERPRHRQPDAEGPAAAARHGQRAVGAARTAGRLPGGRLGPLHRAAEHPRIRATSKRA